MTEESQAPVTPARLAMRSIRKSFGGVEVLHAVDFEVDAGTVHALLGENGAGKSTLMKIVSGEYTADSGKIFLDGHEQAIRTAKAAGMAGIAMIRQELSYVPRLTVAENLALGHLPHTGPGIMRWRQLFTEARDALQTFGVAIDLRSLMSDLPLGQRQIVEIVRAVRQRARILIMDEPTASLTESEVQRLFGIIRVLKAQDVAIIYISHHLEEVFAIADTVSVLRDGQRVVTRTTSGCTRHDLISYMVGRDVSELYLRSEAAHPEPVLELRGLSAGRLVRDVSLTVHKGEVVGVYGLIGAGQDTLARALFGLVPSRGGELLLHGQLQRFRSPAQALAAGVGFVPPDRKEEGLVLGLSVKANLTLPLLDLVSWHRILAGRKEMRMAVDIARRVRVRSAGLGQKTMYLSGGNQQKVVLGRWLARGVKILLLNEPTRGVDVGAKAEIYEAIRLLTRNGVAVLLFSSDLPEVLSITDRIAVIVRGRITTVVDARQATQQQILHYATAQGGDNGA